jgi:hypothetical protein
VFGRNLKVPPPPPDIWLDWAHVRTALRGQPVLRALTTYEVACAVATVQRDLGLSETEAVRWIRGNTRISVSELDGFGLRAGAVKAWCLANGLPYLTVAQAIHHENRPDVRVAQWAGESGESDEQGAA